MIYEWQHVVGSSQSPGLIYNDGFSLPEFADGGVLERGFCGVYDPANRR